MSNNNSMAEQDLYQDIIDNQKTESKVSQEEKKISTWLVFKSEESVYAIESVYIKEILNNNDCIVDSLLWQNAWSCGEVMYLFHFMKCLYVVTYVLMIMFLLWYVIKNHSKYNDLF